MPFEFKRLEIEDIILINSKKFEDQRGYFLELYREDDFLSVGIKKPIKQINLSKSSKGVIRGLHYQIKPCAQDKIVRVVSGSVFDVAVDIRKDSKTFGKWVGVNLSAESYNMLYIPEGFAHGFEVLSESAEFEYLCTGIYSKDHDRGIKFDDPFLNIPWTTKDPIVSEKDLHHPIFKEADYNF